GLHSWRRPAMPDPFTRTREYLAAPVVQTRHDSADALPQDGRRVFIEGIEPQIDAGAHAVKRIHGDTLVIHVDLLADGHDLVAGEVLVRRPSRYGSSRHGSSEPGSSEHVGEAS